MDPSPQPTAHMGAGSTQDAPAGAFVTALLQPGSVSSLFNSLFYLTRPLPEIERLGVIRLVPSLVPDSS